MANAYQLGPIGEITDSTFGGRTRYGLDVIGVIGKPLVRLDFDTQEKAERARTQMAEVAAAALQIEPLFVR
jgi:hypothetical protein